MQFISFSFHQRIHSECVKAEKPNVLQYKIKEPEELSFYFCTSFSCVLLTPFSKIGFYIRPVKKVTEVTPVTERLRGISRQNDSGPLQRLLMP